MNCQPSLLRAAKAALELLRDPDASGFDADKVEVALADAIARAERIEQALPHGLTLGPDGLPTLKKDA